MGGGTPLKNSDTSDFCEIQTTHVNQADKNNKSSPNTLGDPVRELMGAMGAEVPPKIKMHPILVKFKPYM